LLKFEISIDILQTEALEAFVQPEILEGRDQYFCEKCNKKCDAHKVRKSNGVYKTN
jgi:ubiquitin C-terminal hydrolase